MGRIIKHYENGVVYGLHDPITGNLRYIGQTVIPLKTRLCGHVSSAKVPTLPKDYWVLGLLREGFRPIIREIEVVPLSDMDKAESRWIQHFKEQGADLLNRQQITKQNYMETEEYQRLRAAEKACEPVIKTPEESRAYHAKFDREFYEMVKRSWGQQATVKKQLTEEDAAVIWLIAARETNFAPLGSPEFNARYSELLQAQG
jgi:hypothetical protein